MQKKNPQLQEELTKLENQFKKANKEVEQLYEHSTDLTNQEATLDTRLRKHLNYINHLKGKLSTVEGSLRDMEGGHVKVLTEELNLAKEKLLCLQEEEVKLSEQENNLRKKTKQIDATLTAIRQEIGNEKVTLNDELAEEQLNFDRNNSEIVAIDRAMKDEKEKIESTVKMLKEHQALVDEKIQAAQELCPRIEDTREINTIVTELKKVETKLNTMKKNGPSKQELAVALKEKQNQHKITLKLLENLSMLIDMVEKISKQHLSTAQQIQALIANRVQFCFQSILKLRGYSGSMEINNSAGILDIRCTGRDSASVRVADSTSSLSGGERSYATVAFIMALWDCMELPFYFLDEFDVFMDNVNRKTTMELLIHHAHQNTNRQYVFLTPQDSSTLVATDEIKIHRLADPVRTRHTQS